MGNQGVATMTIATSAIRSNLLPMPMVKARVAHQDLNVNESIAAIQLKMELLFSLLFL